MYFFNFIKRRNIAITHPYSQMFKGGNNLPTGNLPSLSSTLEENEHCGENVQYWLICQLSTCSVCLSTYMSFLCPAGVEAGVPVVPGEGHGARRRRRRRPRARARRAARARAQRQAQAVVMPPASTAPAASAAPAAPGAPAGDT